MGYNGFAVEDDNLVIITDKDTELQRVIKGNRNDKQVVIEDQVISLISLIENMVEKEKLTLPFTYDPVVIMDALYLFYGIEINDILSNELFQKWLSDNELQVSISNDNLLFEHKTTHSSDELCPGEITFDKLQFMLLLLFISGVITTGITFMNVVFFNIPYYNLLKLLSILITPFIISAVIEILKQRDLTKTQRLVIKLIILALITLIGIGQIFTVF